MKKLANLLRLDFLPRSGDLGLLVLRIWIGVSMLALHGWGKAKMLWAWSDGFPDLFGIGPIPTLILVVWGEFAASILLVLGLFTRLAALSGVITMSVAFFMAHKGALSGDNSGEMAFIYLAAYATLLIAGGGRFTLDAKTGGKA